MDKVIILENVKKNFGNEEALKGMTIEIAKGEVFGLLGPSGSGKTTTIKILTGELEPSEGRVEVLDQSHESFNSTQYVKSLGILSDNSALYERLTVKDNLALFRKLYNTDQVKVDQVLKDVGLEKHINKRVKDLSKGMKQRILLCKAVLHEPEVLFLDEPTSALDPATTESIHDMLLKIKAQGTTIMLTTHNMDEATALCDTVAFLNNGTITDMGSPESLRQAYKTNEIHITYRNGTIRHIQRSIENRSQLETALFDPEAVNIESDYPTLGEVFKKVTGKELV
ncbi:ABC transporter ATP-binding protein [Salinicoccus roseus]|uniref:ABC transporter ATP-binding protein n=1 Tax=Salinicoccus roseus TaxID=45670 RepID=UPI002301C5C3|nr:ABC transporter ATP-binding protein [Salinicoccus roseus]